MDLLDATIVNVAGPSIHRELGGGASTIQWLSAAYTLAFAVLLIAGARLGDNFGRRRMFLLGLAGFTAFSAACAISQDTGMLIAFRALQGGFGALMIPQGFGLLKEVFDDEELGRATRLFGPSTVWPCSAHRSSPVHSSTPTCGASAGDWSSHQRADRPHRVSVRHPVAAERVSHLDFRLDVGGVWLVGLALVAIIYPLIRGAGRRLASLDVRAPRSWRGTALRLCALSDAAATTP